MISADIEWPCMAIGWAISYEIE